MGLIDAILQRCDELMKEKGIKANEVATRGGMTPSTLYSFLHESRKFVSVNVVLKICLGLGVSLSEFFQSPLFDDIDPDL